MTAETVVPGDPARELRVWVPGVPAAQGSKRAVGRRRNGSTILIEQSKRVKPWRERVADCVGIAAPGWQRLDGPVAVQLDFVLPRRVSHPRTGTVYATMRPDVDKMMRAVLDALSAAGVWHDDSQVTTVERMTKRIAERAGGHGVMITIRPDKYL